MKDLFKTLLLQADPKLLAEHSRMDHHAIGMHYLCLHRSPDMTVKLYWVTEDAQNLNSGFLIHPHNHRYTFDTYILRGTIQHLKFGIMPGSSRTNASQLETKFVNPEVGFTTRKRPPVALLPLESRRYGAGTVDDHYRVVPQDIHTLKVEREAVLGLIQYADTDMKTSIYIPEGLCSTKLDCTGSVMTENQYAAIANALLNQINANPFFI